MYSNLLRMQSLPPCMSMPASQSWQGGAASLLMAGELGSHTHFAGKVQAAQARLLSLSRTKPIRLVCIVEAWCCEQHCICGTVAAALHRLLA